jgi:uncharacterized SAM-binding protein YcdF (DUF218 family)
MLLSSDEAGRIAEYLTMPGDEPQHADLAFVFGTHLPQPAHIAANLFERGTVRWVVVTGGKNRITGANEAQAHLQILLARGVPGDRIIVEDESTNTLENVRLALPRIAAHIAIEDMRTVVVIAKWYHCRRATMTLRHGLPGVRCFAVTYEPPDVTRANWWLSEAGCQKVLKERHLISEYIRSNNKGG